MRAIAVWVCLFLVSSVGYSQDSLELDQQAYLSRATQLIEKHKFASAHAVYDSAMNRLGFNPDIVCGMVENALENHFLQENMEVFYLADSITNPNDKALISKPPRVTVFYYPDRLLVKLLEEYPQSPRGHKLIADYFRLQLQRDNTADLLNSSTKMMVAEKVLKHYLRAVELGYTDPEVNRWIGEAYYQSNHPQKAREFFLKNVEQGNVDPESYVYLAQLYFDDKQYSKSVNFASKALEHSDFLDVRLRYQATQVAALSLFHLGDEQRFEDYIVRCIRYFPDRQDVYIDLLNYYHSNEQRQKERKMIREMLLNNPYRVMGYKYLEKYSLRNNNFTFADSLFEELIMKYEVDEEVLGNVYRFRGNLAFHQGLTEDARKLWEISRNYYRYLFPDDDLRIREVGDISRDSSMK